MILISEWYKYPQLYNKKTSEYHDRDKRVLAKEAMAQSVNEALGYEENDVKRMTGISILYWRLLFCSFPFLPKRFVLKLF
jgi:hypothetical protein